MCAVSGSIRGCQSTKSGARGKVHWIEVMCQSLQKIIGITQGINNTYNNLNQLVSPPK